MTICWGMVDVMTDVMDGMQSVEATFRIGMAYVVLDSTGAARNNGQGESDVLFTTPYRVQLLEKLGIMSEILELCVRDCDIMLDIIEEMQKKTKKQSYGVLLPGRGHSEHHEINRQGDD